MVDEAKNKNRALCVHLGKPLRTRWDKYCEVRGIKPSKAIKELVEKELMKFTNEDEQREIETIECADQSRVGVLIVLTKSEREKIAEHSKVEGCSSRYFMVRAIRAALTNDPQFTMPAITALWEYAYQLKAIGRNLNQIARKLNVGDSVSVTVENINKLNQFIETHLEKQSKVVTASMDRWTLK